MKRVTLVVALAILITLGGAAFTPTQEPARDDLKPHVDAAVAAAVKRLKWLQESNGVWKYDAAPRDEDKNMGCTALAGLALLEGGVPANDAHVSKAASYIRVSAPQLEGIYAISLAIMFLDRFGGPAESYTIERLARRLVRSQADGGWSYTWNASGGSSPSTPGAISVIGGAGPGPAGGGPVVIPDHSNTQFAILALWVARKHGADVNAALQAAERRFRSMQAKDGGWGYGTLPGAADKSTPAMTCAGLLGIALGHGAAVEKEAKLRAAGRPGAPPAAAPRPPIEGKQGPDIAEDPAVKAAVAYLAKQVGMELDGIPEWMYFLWSLERVCVAYKFDKIGQTDWYDWGARKLLKTQDGDGIWFAKYGPVVDTSWAILFLRRSDLVGNIRVAEIRTGKNPEPAKPGAAKPGEPAKPNAPARKTSPDDTADVDASKLASDLVYAKDQRREELIAEYQRKPGVAHTLALATAIKDLPAGAQEKARTALATRLRRFSLSTLERYLEDNDRELRLAAAGGARLRANRDAVPALIRALKDRDSAVSAAAHEALKELTGQKFGREPEPWEAWWKANGG